ncbi:hypothetical protein [Hymenobacter tenuis]
MVPRILLAALAATPLAAAAGPASISPDSLGSTSASTVVQVPSDSTHPWYRPRHFVAQTGGGLGMVTVGAGYSFWQERTDLDVLLGYVPKKYAGSALTVISAKFTYSPWHVPVGKKWAIKPLSVGAYVSYTSGIANKEKPGQYPKGYYWFSTDTRFGPLLGSRLSYALAPTASGRPRNLSAYYELGSNDLYVISYVQNPKGLSPADILTLSLGVKLDF